MTDEEGDKVFDPDLVQHCLEEAERVFGENKPVVVEPPPPYAGPRAWFVVESVSRGEDDVVDLLTKRGHDAYLPMMKRERWNKKAKKAVTLHLILFNRYVFARLPVSPADWGDLLQQEAIHDVVGYLVPRDEVLMMDIRQRAEAGVFDDTAEADAFRAAEAKANARANRRDIVRMFPKGSKVKATAGPFGGFSGLVTNVTGKGAVQAMVEIFGRLTPVEFDAKNLDLVEVNALPSEQG